VRFKTAPFGIGEVALICFSHARYPTGRVPQNPFSGSFKQKLELLLKRLPRTRVNKASRGRAGAWYSGPSLVEGHPKELSHRGGGPYVLVYAEQVSRVLLVLYGN
jgi:hypothetical protein